MECKTAAMSFFQKLRRLTNNRFHQVHVSVMHGRCEPCADTSQESLQGAHASVKQWRDLLVRKRFGYGHETEKVPGMETWQYVALHVPTWYQSS